MKRALGAALFASLLAFSANASREVAYCDPGFDIQKVSGDKAVCAKSESYRDYVGNRNCVPGTNYTGKEANDGGDLCDAAGGALGAQPAVLCEIDPTRSGSKTEMIKGGRDRCYVTKTRTVFGNVKTRME